MGLIAFGVLEYVLKIILVALIRALVYCISIILIWVWKQARELSMLLRGWRRVV